MAKYYIKLSYDGKYYFGFAKQPNVLTIQGEMEKYLLGKIIPSSRTDRYVHAKNQIVSLEVKKKLSKKEIYSRVTNLHKNTKGIKIKTFKRTLDNWNPRYSAKIKTYKYLVNTKISQKKHDYFYAYGRKVDIKKISTAAKLLVGEMDFASFTAKENYPSFVRKIKKISIRKRRNKIIFTIVGNSFMRFQVRNIVGSLLAYERNSYSFDQFKDLINNPKKGKSHYKAPGSGLYLMKIKHKK